MPQQETIQPNSRHHISSVAIEHFKSFGPNSEIFLKPSFNVICGPNGTGKSNTLDAIIFALAQEQSVLRITSWAELANRSNRGPCAVRLTITETNKGSDDLVLLAHAKADGTRTFKVNGVNATTQKVKEELQTVGLNAGSSAFAVRQHAAMKELTASGLTALLAQTSGAAQWKHSTESARQQLAKEKATLDEVASDIQALEQIFAKEREAKSSLTRQVSLLRREKHARTALRELAQALGKSCRLARENAIATARSNITDSKRAAATALEARDAAKARHEAQHKQTLADTKAATAAITAAEGAAETANDVDALLVHADVLAAEAAAAAEAARADREASEEKRRERQLVAYRLHGAREAARNAASEAEAFQEIIASAARRASAAASDGWFVDSLLTEAEEQVKARLQAMEEEAASNPQETLKERMDALRAEHAQNTWPDLQAEKRRLDELVQTRRALEVRAAEAQAAADGGADMSESELNEAIKAADAAVIDAERREKKAALALGHYDDATPTLCSVMKLKQSDKRLGRCLGALQVIAGSDLNVRITQTREEALPLLAKAREKGHGVRVWPIKAIQTHDHTEAHLKVQQRFGNQDVIRPLELVSTSREMQPALKKAFGSALIVSNDDLAAKVGKEHGLRCVTLGGSVHSANGVVSLSGGYREPERLQKGFASMLERERCAAATELAKEKAESLRAKSNLLAAASNAAAAAATALADENEASANVERMQERLEAEDEDIGEQVEEIGQQVQSATYATSDADGLRGDLDLIRRAQGDGGSQRGKVATVLSELEGRISARAAAARTEAGKADAAAVRHDEADDAGAHADIEADALLEQRKEQLEAFEHAVGELRKAEEALTNADKTAREASDKAEHSTQLDAAARSESRRTTLELEAATTAVQSAEREAKDLDEAAESSVPDVALRWEGADDDDAEEMDGEVLDDEEEEEEEDEEEEDEGVIEVLTPEERSAKEDGGPEWRDSLTKRLNAGELLMETWRRQRREMHAEHGSLAELRAYLHACNEGRKGTNPVDQLADLKKKSSTVEASVEKMTVGIEEMKVKVKAANAEAVEHVRVETKRLFESLVPALELELECDDPEALEENGARFKVRSSAAGREWRTGLSELSGGQKTMLNLSLLLAVAQHRPSMVLLMDEVDAALDEVNAKRVAELLKEISKTSQVIAISHRVEFQKVADHFVELRKNGSYTAVGGKKK